MGPNGAKLCDTVPKRAIWAKQGKMRLNCVKQGQTGPNGAKWGQTGPIGPKQCKMETNGDKRGQLGQNLFKDGDCLRDGDHPRDRYFP